MDISALEKEIQELKKKVAVLEDLEAIKRLQRTYGYYLEHWMHEEIIDLFADRPDTKLDLQVGVFLGKEGIRHYFSSYKDIFGKNPDLLHQIMQLSGIVDVAPDGRTAAGRWYGFGMWALPLGGNVSQALATGIYTMEYIREDGKWKIWKFMWNPVLIANPTVGWIKPERWGQPGKILSAPPCTPDQPREVQSHYPSGYIPPFHYSHPVTGEPTSEQEHNRDIKAKKSE